MVDETQQILRRKRRSVAISKGAAVVGGGTVSISTIVLLWNLWGGTYASKDIVNALKENVTKVEESMVTTNANVVATNLQIAGMVGDLKVMNSQLQTLTKLIKDDLVHLNSEVRELHKVSDRQALEIGELRLMVKGRRN
jgi:hypothetical protein